MSLCRCLVIWLVLALALAIDVNAIAIAASASDSRPFSAAAWRLIGPFRGGRTVAVAGVPTQRGVFYMAPSNGGVWKSLDYGRTWNPIFDGQDTGSIGALAVAPSEPSTIYVGSGEGLRRPDLSTGDGMYKSVDAGKTWTHQGLCDGQQIQAIAVDPHDSKRLFVAVVGHPYGPNAQRGLYRSTDGGASYARVLGGVSDAGAVSVSIDPSDTNVVYAALWASRNGPWNLLQVYERYENNGLYKSIDGGSTWVQLHGGLPQQVGRIGFSIAASDSRRLYAIVETPHETCGVFRSDDAGASWRRTNSEERVCGRADDFAGITADPHDADTVYSANTTTYRSTDGGRTWIGIKGAPGGDDYHTVWVDPTDSNVILLGVDQGATVSTDYGRTWSSWYNQPTAQFYHVITDDRFPYRVFGAQQESGSAEVASRGNDGAISFREFHPVGVEEYGYVAPDPLHPWLIYGGKATVYNERTGQTQDVSPTYDRRAYRFDRTNPLIWSHLDKHALYLGLNVVFVTRDGGSTWHRISPDLTRRNPGEPATLRRFRRDDPLDGKHRGVIYSLAPSYVDVHRMWAGTDDGLVWLTPDSGAHWRSVTPRGIGPWSRVTQIDASHFDSSTAYVSVSRQRLDDLQPLIFRTHDSGRTWQRIVSGLPRNAPVNTVREDSQRRGLLFCGTERSVYVSFNDGANWQSLQGNLPSTSIRDLVVHDDDIVVGTHGRSFWILDDIAPLRDIAAAGETQPAHLFRPAHAWRVRFNTNTDTPLPPDEPVGQNPPDGAIIDYRLRDAVAGSVRIEIVNASGRIVRAFASTDHSIPIAADIPIPTYWVRPEARPSTSAGDHRFVWDLHEAAPRSVAGGYPISAVVHATPLGPQGVWALPGSYTVQLTVAGRTYSRPLLLRLDPRVMVASAALKDQHEVGLRIVGGLNRSYALYARATARHDRLTATRYARLNAELTALLDDTQSADAAPTAAAQQAVSEILRVLQSSPTRAS